MEPKPSSSPSSGGGTLGSARRFLWGAGVWSRLAVGLGLAATGGVAFGHAWTSDHGRLWWVGLITLLSGVLLVLSGLYARRQAPITAADVTPEEEAGADSPAEHLMHSPTLQEPLVPLLGALLVYKFQYLDHRDLSAALEQQLKEGRKRRLGDVLVARGAITPEQLREALEHQALYLREREKDEAKVGDTSPSEMSEPSD